MAEKKIPCISKDDRNDIINLIFIRYSADKTSEIRKNKIIF